MTRNQRFTLVAVLVSLIAFVIAYIFSVPEYNVYIFGALLVVLAILVVIFARGMSAKEIIRRSLWGIACGVLALVLTHWDKWFH